MHAISGPSALPQPSGDADPRTWRVSGITKLTLLVAWGFIAFTTLRLLGLASTLIEIWPRLSHAAVVTVLSSTIMLVCLVVWGLQMLPVLNMWLSFDDDALHGRWLAWRSILYPGPLLSLEVPYREIVRVERREELYSFLFIPFVRSAYTLMTREGARISLAFGREMFRRNIDYAELANEIARRIGTPVADGGVVLGSGGRVFCSRRPPADATPLPAHEQMRLRQRAHAVPALLGVTLLLICGVYVFSRWEPPRLAVMATSSEEKQGQSLR